MIGGILDVTFTKETVDARPVIASAGLIPIVTQYDRGFRNIRLSSVEQLYAGTGQKPWRAEQRLQIQLRFYKNTLDTVIGAEFLEEYRFDKMAVILWRPFCGSCS